MSPEKIGYSMIPTNWQLQTPISAIVFDCDGTLSAIEGIDELARMNGVYEAVAALTAKAMGETGLNLETYQERLALVKPNQQQLETLSHAYLTNCVQDALPVIQTLMRLNKSIYIVSAGLNPAVTLFGESLNIPRENIYAVDLKFDAHGNYLDFDHTSPLVNLNGKRVIVSDLKLRHETILHIGDGLNDYDAHDLVTRFVGFGGFFYRENLEKLCKYYIKTPSLVSLLPLALTQDEYTQLSPSELDLYLKGIEYFSI